MDLPLLTKWDSVVDEGICKGTTNWQLFGSKKPGNQAYELKYSYNFEIDLCDGEFMQDEIVTDIATDFFKLSVQYPHHQKFPILIAEIEIDTPIKQKVGASVSSGCADNNKQVKRINAFFENGLLEESCSSHPEWIKFGYALINECGFENAKELFGNVTEKYGSENKRQEWEEKIDELAKGKPKEPATMGFINNLAKKNDPEKYKKVIDDIKAEEAAELSKAALVILKKTLKPQQCINTNTGKSSITAEQKEALEETLASITQFQLALAYKAFYGDRIKFIENKKWCEFDESKIWKMTAGNDVRKKLSIEFVEEYKMLASTLNDTEVGKLNIINDIVKKLGTTTFKNNMMVEIAEVCNDVHFIDDMNREKNVLPILNGKMLNMKTLEVFERTIANKFSYECDAEYIELSPEQYAFVDTYFMDLFCNNEDTKKCTIDILKSIFSGNILRYVFFATGDGSNGKSLLFKVLNTIFNKSMDIISKLVITRQKGNQPNINTEVEKLDKIRCGFVTELREEDIMNETMIKAISGGDGINLRGLQKTDVTITPTANLVTATNQMPNFDTKDKAFINRLAIIPFNNHFEIDTTFEEKLLKNRDWIFSYIMKVGTIRDKFEFPDEMIAAKNMCIEDNEEDHLQDFIGECVEMMEGKKVKRDELRLQYNTWCQERKIPIDKCNNAKFTRKMKALKINSKESHGKVYYVGIEFKCTEDEEE